MKKSFKRKKFSFTPQVGPDVAGLIGRMQRQLSAMEKKLDTLISQSSKRPFEKSYSPAPFRPLDRPHGRDGERQGDARERTFTKVVCSECKKECEIPFKPSGGRPVYCKECFSKRRSSGPFNANRDNRRPEKRQRPAKEKKPFFAGRKKGI